jgi:lipopolysaccharide transport system permease protein
VTTQIIKPTTGWFSFRLAELWRHRELIYFLTWRDVKVRYKQTALGIAWAVLQPALSMVVFSLFFGRLAKVPSDGIPYPAFAYAALVPWTFFASGLTQTSNSIVGSAALVTKIYFPRLSLPMASVLAGLIDLLVSMLLLAVIMIFYSIKVTAAILWLPVFLALAVITSLGVGLWLSALNVQYRDVRYVLPFLVQLWMFATPIAYPSSLLPEQWRALYALNPMVGVVEGFRWALFSTRSMPALPSCPSWRRS